MQADGIVLRDIHQPPAPPWWPPAPGWWCVLAVVVVMLAIAAVWWLRRRRRRAAIARLFDDTLYEVETPAAQVAAMSQLLRRAARRSSFDADRLDGEAWLAFLDGNTNNASFSQGAGRVLLDGGFRRTLDADTVGALRPLARRRYLELMGARR